MLLKTGQQLAFSLGDSCFTNRDSAINKECLDLVRSNILVIEINVSFTSERMLTYG